MNKLVMVFLVMVTLARLSNAVLVINEVCYDNSSLADEAGNTDSDWVELYNRGPEEVNVLNYGLGDSNPYRESGGVRLPDYTLPPGGYMVVFASGDRPETVAWTQVTQRVMIAPNASWRFRSSREAPPAAWKDWAFDDSSWSSGMAPLGYNDAKANMDCATVLDDGSDPDNRYTAAYFRSAFTVVNPAVLTGLVMRARIDDGLVVYLNGREVLRKNMPESPVTHTTLALASVPSTQWLSALLGTNGVLRGTNVLAVEVHQALASSPDLIMDMTVTGLMNERVPVVHGQFRLAKEGENVHLFNAELTRVQMYAPPGYEIGEDKSYGAAPDGNTSSFEVFDRPTPGQSNASYADRYAETLTAEKPVFSVPPGVYETEQVVTLRTPTAGTKIFFTLDGTDPKAASTFVLSGGSLAVRAAEGVTNGLAWIRTNPVEVDNRLLAAAWRAPKGEVTRAVVLRAIAVDAQGKRCSPETSGTYLIGPRYQQRTLPILSLIGNPDDFFGFAAGLYVPGKYYADSPEGYGENKWGKPYANYFQSNAQQEWERPVQFEWFEPEQDRASVALRVGVTPDGGGTRALPQKTLQVLARGGEYGTNRIDFAFFPQGPVTSFRRLLVRNSGDDWYGPSSGGVATMMKDAVFQELAQTLAVAVTAYRPTVAYLNGEYWGLHNLRESFDKFYLAARYGLDPDSVDLLQHEEDPADSEKVVIQNAGGDANADEEYRALLAWIDAHPLSQSANYQQVQTQVDITNYTDYVIAETFFANSDWPLNNCAFWRAHTNQTAAAGASGDTRWRWVLSDLDRAGESGADVDMFATLSADAMKGVDNPAFLINALWENGDYRNTFVARFERLLNTAFCPGQTEAVVSRAADAIASEMEAHFRRWGRPFTQAQWRQAVDASLIQYAAERHAVLWGQLDAHFAKGGSGVVGVRNLREDGVGGSFVVDGLAIEPATAGVTSRAQWSGRFFKNRAITVLAVPDPGYVFDGWEARAETNALLRVMAADVAQIFVARFVPGATTTCVVTLEANGGTATPASLEVTVGGFYDGLPVPLRAGFTFAGWWTEADGGGKQVTAFSVVETASDHTLYAKWTADDSVEETTVGVAFSLALPDAFEEVDASQVTVKGLPTGLRYDRALGAIVGTATKTGTYAVVMSAAGVSAQTVTVSVASLPLWAQGAFNGYIGSASGGLASMSVTALGKVTGKLVFGGKNYSFSASSYAEGSSGAGGFLVETKATSGATALPLTLSVSGPPEGGLGGAGVRAPGLGVARGTFGGLDGVPFVLYRNLWKDAGMASVLAPYTGYYTATLPGGSAFGSGYLMFTADSAGKVKTAGKLADGIAVSQSGALILDESNRVFTVVYAAPSAYKGGGLFGLAEYVRPEGGGNLTVRLLDGVPFLWTSSNPQATEIYGDGFGRPVGISGGWYSKTDNLYAYYAGKALTVGTDAGADAPELISGTNRFASVWWRPDGVALAVVLNASGVMTGLSAPKPGAPTDADRDGVWDYTSATNTVALTIGLTRATGVFKGSFKAWFDYPEQRHVSKSLAVEGALTPERWDAGEGVEGRGYFQWKDTGSYVNTAGRKVTYPFSWSYDFLLLAP